MSAAISSGVTNVDRDVAVLDAGGRGRQDARAADLLGGQVVAEHLHVQPVHAWRRRWSAGPSRGACARGVLVVGGDDPLHELVADDVVAAEADELDAVDAGEDVAHDHEPGLLVARQVDLRDVAGDDHLASRTRAA